MAPMELTWTTAMTRCHTLRSPIFALGLLVAFSVTSRAIAASEPESDTEESADTSDRDSDSDEPEDVATNEKTKKTISAENKTLSHKGQFQLRVALGASYRIVMRYDDSPQCSSSRNENGELRTLCGFGSPASLDLALGYAPSPGFEPFLWGRFGLAEETDTRTAPLVILGAGARLYTMSDSAFKFFVEPALGLELERGISQGDNRIAQYKQDFILRLSLGPQFDFSRNFGAYAAGGLTVGMLRSLQSWMDLHVGVQARFP